MAKTTREDMLAELRAQREARGLPSLLQREFVFLNTFKGEYRVRIMQWNSLAHGLCRGDDNFVMCNPEALLWENRSLHMLEEILSYDPTVACLQEMDHFAFFSEQLGRVGYVGCFTPKPDSPCLYTKDSVGPDGCAVFWKKSELKLCKQESYILMDSAERATNQVCLMCHFKPATSDEKTKDDFVVATTHLKAKSGYEEMRRQQAQDIVRLLSRLPKTMPVVLCGDFNAAPTEEVYKVLQSSPLGLASAYTLLSPQREEPPYTTCKVRGCSPEDSQEICRTIDYLWYTTTSLAVATLLQFPTLEQMGKKLLPSFTYPSDHLSLVSDFIVL